MTKRLVAVLVVILGMLTFAAVASAEPKVDSSQRLRVQVDPNQSGCNSVDSIAGWVTGQDSPSDSNQHLFHTNVGTPAAASSCSRTRASIATSPWGTRRTSRSSSARRRSPSA